MHQVSPVFGKGSEECCPRKHFVCFTAKRTQSSFNKSVINSVSFRVRSQSHDKVLVSSMINTLADILLNPLPGDKILDWPKLKQIADDNLK